MNRALRTVILGLALVGLAPGLHAAPAQSSGHALQLSDLRKLVRIGSPEVSPDGRHVAVVVSHWDWKNDKSLPAIVLVDVATGKQRTLTWKRKGIGDLKWSHDGSRLAFIAPDTSPVEKPGEGDNKDAQDKGPKRQVFVMPMDGGDPVRVTACQARRGRLCLESRGQRIAY